MKGHRRLHSIFRHPQRRRCSPWRCHIATWAPATLHLHTNTNNSRTGKGRESKGNSLLSAVERSGGGSSLVSALHAWLAWVPPLSPWLPAKRRVAGTCPCWETWRPRLALTVSSFLTSRLLEFTSGFPPSGCQGAKADANCFTMDKARSVPKLHPGTLEAFSCTFLAGTDGAHQGVSILHHISKILQHRDKVRRENKTPVPSWLSLKYSFLRHVLRNKPGSVLPPSGWQWG